MTDWIDVAATEEIPPGQGKLVETDDAEIAVFNVDGNYYAIEDTCTHDEAPMLNCGLEADEILDGDQVICPRHGARFCLKTGAHPARLRTGSHLPGPHRQRPHPGPRRPLGLGILSACGHCGRISSVMQSTYNCAFTRISLKEYLE